MNPVEPRVCHEGGHLVIFAKDQPQYIPLPASVDSDGLVMTEWELTVQEITALVSGGRVRLWMYATGVERGQPLTPVRLEAVGPAGGFRES